MYFHFGVDETVLFEGWKISTVGGNKKKANFLNNELFIFISENYASTF